MNIQVSNIIKLSITGVPHLGPISVYAEDLGPSRGKIVIESDGKSWSASWGSMAGRTIAEFFQECDEHYLSKNLSSIPDNVFAPEKVIPEGTARLQAEMKEIIRQRKVGLLYKDEARKAYDPIVDRLAKVKKAFIFDDAGSNTEVLTAIYGEEWWHELPTKPNPAYRHLCDVIHAVQAGFRSLAPSQSQGDTQSEEESVAPAPGA